MSPLRPAGLRLAAATLIAIHLLALAADLVAPYAPAAQDRTHNFAPPTRLRFVDADGGLHLRPFVYARVRLPGPGIRYREDRSRRFPLRFFVRGEPRPVFGAVELRTRLFAVEEPGRIFLLGTDASGRDRFSRLLYGGRISLFAGLFAAGLSVLLGLVVGSIAGFYGGWVDRALMRLAELFMALPWLYLLFGVRAFLPLSVEPRQAFLLVVLLIGTIGWARPARLFRGVVLSARNRDFVRAARCFGASDFHLLRCHVLPQTRGVLLTQLGILVPQFILAEVTLSFLGLGVGEPHPSWGTLLAGLKDLRVLSDFGWMFLPAAALVVVVLCYQSLASAAQERYVDR